MTHVLLRTSMLTTGVPQRRSRGTLNTGRLLALTPAPPLSILSH